MASSDYIKRREEARKKREKARYLVEEKAKVAKVLLSWNDRRKAAEARGEPFDEPYPYSEEWRIRRKAARQSTRLYRLQHHWVWPHIMILFVVCLVIDIIAVGFGTVWLVKYIAGIEGSGTVFRISTSALLLLGAYILLYKFLRWFYR